MTAEPRAHTPRNLARPTNGPGAALIGEAKGRPWMPWQRRAADVILELDPETGHYWYDVFVVTVQRQSGKTTVEGDLADHRCLTTRRGRAWITMQNGKTVDSWMREEHFGSLEQAEIFGRPGGKECAYSLSRRAGEVGVRWGLTSSTFLTFPPKRDALHSKQSDLALVDEAWVHNAEAGADLRQAIRPTMLTRKGAQLGVLSTLGDDTSAYLDSYVDLARASLGNPDARVCLVDYGIGDDDDPEDLEVIAAAHPAYGHTVTMEGLEVARAEFGADVAGWARAYGNRATRSRVAAFPPEVWAAAARGQRAIPDRAGIGLDVTPAGDRAGITAAWREDDGEAYTEVLYAGPSGRETKAALIALARTRRVPLVADRGSFGAMDLLEAVERDAPDVETQRLSMGQYAAACATYDRGIREDSVHHANDPDLNAAVAVATRRDLGDGGWGWGRKGSTGSICELVSGTVALKAWAMLPPPVERPTGMLTSTSSRG